MNIYIINGHEPFPFAQGNLNKAFVKVAKDTMVDLGHDIKITLIKDEFDPEQIVQNIFWADAILYQTPIYWFGLPGQFKKFIDAVFNTGLMRFIKADEAIEYGTMGQLSDKKYMVSTTWNAPKSIFNNEKGYLLQNKDVDDVLLPFHPRQD